MGILLRDSAENFNPQVHTEENSLAVKMMKHFEVRRKSIELFSRYSKFTSFMYATNRQNRGVRAGRITRAGGANEIYDNAYRVSYEGSVILPAFAFGAAVFGAITEPGVPSPDMTGDGITYTGGVTSGTVATNTIGSIAIHHDPTNNMWGDKFNPNDSIILGGGLGIQLIILDQPRKASTGDHYVLNFKTVGPAADYDAGHVADGEVLTEAGNFFGQGSIKGYQRHVKNRWRINYSSIRRYSLTMTGSAKQQKVAWIYNSDNRQGKMWEFQEVLRGEETMYMMDELALRYSRISMDPSTHAWYENVGSNSLTLAGFNAETGLTAPIVGDGWVPQIKENALFEYNPNTGLSYLYIQAMMMSLANRSPAGSTGNTFVFVTDTVGSAVIDESLKKLLGWGNALGDPSSINAVTHVMTDVSGEDTTIGFKLKRFTYLNNDIVVIEDELLNHPGLHQTSGGVTGTGHIYCLNATSINGISNMEILARAGRSFIKKYQDGMHSLSTEGERSSFASSGFDGCSVHMLRESMAVLYDARSCGILKATAKWNGGALNGSAFLTANPDATSFIF